MAVVKGIIAGVLALAGLGLIGLGSLSAAALREAPPPARSAPALALRAFPPGADAAAGAPSSTRASEPTRAPEPPAVPVEVHDAGVPVARPPDAGVAKVSPPDAGAPKAVAAPPVAMGVLNLHATDTADVYVDGRRVGSSPVEGLKVRTGTRRVRFDCYDSAGNAVQGPVQSVTVTAEQPAVVSFTCPAGG